MNDGDQTATWLGGMGESLRERLFYEDAVGLEDRLSADSAAGLVSLGFIGAALRRGWRVWCAFALVSVILCCAWYVAFPSAQQATVSVLLIDNPNQNPDSEIQTDMALAQSAPVAGDVIRQLGLKQTPSDFLDSYKVIQVSDQVLTLTVGAPDSNQAVRIASALAAQFLKFRSQYTLDQQTQTEAQLNQQISQAQQHLNSIAKQISDLSSQSKTSGQQRQLGNLRDQQAAATTALQEIRQYVTSTLASTRTATQAMVQGSQVLNDATAVKHSRLKGALLYVAGGLVGGIAVGMAIVIVGAVTSDRLRRRDDIAFALGAPVRFSVGPLRRSHWVPDLRRRGGLRARNIDRFVEHLRKAVPGSSPGPASLGVVAVDNASDVARAVIELAVSIAEERWQVVLADLSAGAHAARLLGVRSPGISTVTYEGADIVVAVPASDDVAPTGPLRHSLVPKETADDESLAAACARADLVLSLVTLDPALGGEFLATWATDVVAVVTAGQSTAVRIHAVGEMVRLSGAHLESVVVIDADKGDESLGTTSTAYQPASH